MRKDWHHGAGGSADGWDLPDPPPLVDEWMARQVIQFHERGDVPCAGCARGLICERLAMARAVIAALAD